MLRLPLFLFAAALWAQPSYDTATLRKAMIASGDGVKLATDIYLPARDGANARRQIAAVVERTPYGKHNAPPALTSYFVSRGYAVVIQDVRGRCRSEGRWRPIRDDGPDGAVLTKWIGEQSWSSGKVGTMGTSYPGATQHAMALANVPNLAAMVPVDAMSNYGRYGIRHHGAFELRWLNWIFTLGNATGTRASANSTTGAATASPICLPCSKSRATGRSSAKSFISRVDHGCC